MMSSSPYQFVPSTPCIHVSHRKSDWSSYNSPAAVVPEFRETCQTNNNRGFVTQTAVVPHTPNSQTSINNRNLAHRRRWINVGSPFIASPRVGQCAETEQIVPSTPHGTSYRVREDSRTRHEAAISQKSHLTTPKPSRREAILKERRSPQQGTSTRDNAIDLFSGDQIFS